MKADSNSVWYWEEITYKDRESEPWASFGL